MSGYRFGANTGMVPASSIGGSVTGSFVGANRRGRGRASDMPDMRDGDSAFYAGQGGVETYPGCYGLPTYCGWQQVAGSNDIAPGAAGTVSVIPTVSPYFEPKAVYLFGLDPAAPGTNLRFTIGAVTVGGSPQLAINTLTPTGGAPGSLGELLSDVFNRSDQPLLCNWSVFSTTGLARELQINCFNLNAVTIRIFACIWGNAVSSLDAYA